MNTQSTATGWSLDKRVSLPVFILMLAYFAGGIFWVAYTDTRLDHIEVQISGNRAILERITRIEANLEYHTGTLGRIERYLEKQD